MGGGRGDMYANGDMVYYSRTPPIPVVHTGWMHTARAAVRYRLLPCGLRIPVTRNTYCHNAARHLTVTILHLRCAFLPSLLPLCVTALPSVLPAFALIVTAIAFFSFITVLPLRAVAEWMRVLNGGNYQCSIGRCDMEACIE